MFKQIIERIFSNWTALRLAVEHCMGGPDSKQVALDTMEYITQYCMSEPNLDVEDIEDELDDIMDQKFNTFCEDDSIREVSQLLYSFLQLLNADWLKITQRINEPVIIETPSTSSQLMTEEDMVDDPEWTRVKSRRKR
ncbi:hypothetical protein Trydic_g15002 [Trypoxylus dichotomus]